MSPIALDAGSIFILLFQAVCLSTTRFWLRIIFLERSETAVVSAAEQTYLTRSDDGSASQSPLDKLQAIEHPP
jgi:hypothetical protein